MNRPKIKRDEAIRRMVLPITHEVFLLGFRGYYQDSMGKPGVNDRGIYDDCICLVAPNLFLTFNANTDPSIFRKEIATLMPGRHMYKQGLHGITKKNPYPAFRPATDGEKLPVSRDGEKGTFWGIAINMHCGGENTTSSEGCQTIYKPQWREFQTTTYKQMDQFAQREIPYDLIVWEQ